MSDAEDQAQKIVNRMNATWVKAGRSQFETGIGTAVLALIERGESLTAESIIDYLQLETDSGADLIIRSRNEAAEEALLAAVQKNCQ